MRRIPRQRAALVAAAAVAALAVTPFTNQHAAAAIRDWSAGSGNFNTPANWSGALVPVAGDAARFFNPATYTVTFDLSPTNASAEIGAGVVTFRADTIASRTYTLTNLLQLTAGSLTLAAPPSGTNTLGLNSLGGISVGSSTFNVQANNDVAVTGTLAVNAGGTLSVSGAGSTLQQNGASFTAVGAGGGAAALVSLTSGGAITTGAGSITIGPVGTISVNGGSFTANGSILVDGGRLERLTGSGFTLAAANPSSRRTPARLPSPTAPRSTTAAPTSSRAARISRSAASSTSDAPATARSKSTASARPYRPARTASGARARTPRPSRSATAPPQRSPPSASGHNRTC